MSTFSSATFKAGLYLLSRPSYPRSLYEYIAKYTSQCHSANNLAIDVGCGPGEATVPLTNYYDHVLGIDQSRVMISTADSKYENLVKEQIVKFAVGSGDNLIESVSGQLDRHTGTSPSLITVAQAFHWFDHDQFFREAHQLLAPTKGTLAYWGYVDSAFTKSSEASQLILEYSYGDHCLGPYWEQPGRNLLRNLLRDIEVPTNLYENIEHHYNADMLTMKKSVPLSAILDYMKTFSAYHAWKTEHPLEKDIAEEFYEKIKNSQSWKDDTEVEIQWQTTLTLARAK